MLCKIYLRIGSCHRHCTKLLHVSHEFLQSLKVPRKYIRSPQNFTNPIFLSLTKWYPFNFFISRVDAREFVAIMSGSLSQTSEKTKGNFCYKSPCSFSSVGVNSWGAACLPRPPPPRPHSCEAALPSCEETWKVTGDLKKSTQCSCCLAVYNQL